MPRPELLCVRPDSSRTCAWNHSGRCPDQIAPVNVVVWSWLDIKSGRCPDCIYGCKFDDVLFYSAPGIPPMWTSSLVMIHLFKYHNWLRRKGKGFLLLEFSLTSMAFKMQTRREVRSAGKKKSQSTAPNAKTLIRCIHISTTWKFGWNLWTSLIRW